MSLLILWLGILAFSFISVTILSLIFSDDIHPLLAGGIASAIVGIVIGIPLLLWWAVKTIGMAFGLSTTVCLAIFILIVLFFIFR